MMMRAGFKLCCNSTFVVSRAQSVAKGKRTNLRQAEEQSSFGLLFNEITEILGAENVVADKTPSGFLISKDTHVGVGQIPEEKTRACLPSAKTAVEFDEVKEKEDVAVVEETDVSPVVHEVTGFVRVESDLVALEKQLDEMGFEVDMEVVEKVLKRCFKVPRLALRFFDWVKAKEGFCHTTKIYNTVLSIAGGAKEFGLVERLVVEMERNSCEKDVKTWTILIRMYGDAKLVGKVLLVYEKMRKSGFEPDALVYRMMIRALCAAGKGDVVMEFYKEMVQKDISVDIKMYMLLLSSVVRCEDATAFVSLISDDMMRVSNIPEHVVYGCVLKSFCVSARMRQALEYIRELKNKDVMLLPEYFETLLSGLCRADRVADALEIFDIMKKRDFVDGNVYGVIINGYLRKNNVSKALDLFQSMKESGYMPTTSTYTELMQHFFNANEYQKGCELHDEMLERGIELDNVAVTAITAGHIRRNNISEAWKVFNHMKDKGIKPTSKSYMVFIKELCKISKTDEILKVLVHMQACNMHIPDVIFNWVIPLMETNGELDRVEKVKQMQTISNFQPHNIDVSSNEVSTGERIRPLFDPEPKKLDPLVKSHAYSDKDLQEICKVLSSSTDWCLVQEALEKSDVIFIPGLVLAILKCHSGHGLVALQFFSWVGKQSGYRHTTDTYNMAIKIAGRGKDFKHMRNLFHEMGRNHFPITQDTWTIMIMQYGRTGLTKMALQCFQEMKSNCNPTDSTYKYLIISLCERKGRKVDEAIKIFEEMIRVGYRPDKELVETYTGCLCEVGKLSDARRCIDSLPKVGYSLYIRALCRAGRLQEASALMDNIGEEQSTLVRLTYGSFVHGLLRSGQVEEALSKVESMKQAGMKTTVHVYTSLIVHFFKEKQIKRALEMFNEMEREGCEPTVVTYSALIRGYMNMEMTAEAWGVFHDMKLKGPSPDFKTYSMFLHCLCKAGKSEEAMQLISEMSNSGIVPSAVNFRTLFYGLNREGKHDLAHTVMGQKSSLIRKRKFLI